MTQAVTTFVTFDMPSDVVDKFKTEWLKDAAFIAEQPGLKSGTLYRRIGGDGRISFVNVAHWESEETMKAARGAALAKQRKEGWSQAVVFAELSVSVSAENYVVEVPY